MSFIQGSLLCLLFRGLYCVGVSIVSFIQSIIQGSLLCPLLRGLYCVLYSGVSIVSFIFGCSFMGGSITSRDHFSFLPLISVALPLCWCIETVAANGNGV